MDGVYMREAIKFLANKLQEMREDMYVSNEDPNAPAYIEQIETLYQAAKEQAITNQ